MRRDSSKSPTTIPPRRKRPSASLGVRKPVFLDQSGRRARIVNVLMLIAVVILCSGIGVVAYGVVNAPSLQKVETEKSTLSEDRTVLGGSWPDEPPMIAARNRRVGEAARQSLRLAVFAEEDTGALVSLMRHADKLDGLIPQWFSLRTQGGRPQVVQTVAESPALPWIKKHAPSLSLYPQLTADTSAADLVRHLASPADRDMLLGQLERQLDTLGADGIVVDMSTAIAGGGRDLVIFLASLRDRLKKDGREVIFAAPIGAAPAYFAATAPAVDYVLLQAHDNTGEQSLAWPSASQGYFEDQLAKVLRVIPADKLIVSIGSYAYDWKLHRSKELISVQAAWDRMAASGARLAMDTASLNSSFGYRAEDGVAHTVWMLDAASAFNQVSAALAMGPAGIAVWRLGMEDPGIWSFAGKGLIPGPDTPALLAEAPAGFGAFASAKGALLSAAPGNAGRRSLGYNGSLGLVVAQAMETVPREAEFFSWYHQGARDVALTFDDGPDPLHTPQILDILKARGARATFYMVGSKVVKDSAIARRVVAEGHDIGNHSFLHPDLFDSGADRIAAELTATQSTFEAELGVRSVLFRPPFALTGYHYLEGSPTLYSEASRLGYVFGGIDIDAFDYFVWSADQIAERVIEGVREGAGQVVLLHDAGGDRSATIAALPLIIDTLAAEGYRFVTTHELVGLPREALMQPHVAETLAVRLEDGIRVTVMASFTQISRALPFLAIGLAAVGMARLAVILAAALIQRRRQGRRLDAPFRGSIAVLVPAFNEETVIARTIDSLLASTIADRLAIAVVDDGSSDRTSDVVRRKFAGDSRVRVHRKENGGKAAALNYAIARSKEDLLIAIDGDTLLKPDAVEKLIRPFADARVGAVAGKVVVGNEFNLLTRFQALEYLVGQGLERPAFELFRAIGVVPGAIGAWRRSALVQVGGYSSDTLAEDADLTVSLQRHGWRVVSAPDAIALTEAPETVRAFMKQRFRWLFGTLQVAWKHRGALVKGPIGIAFVTLPNIVFQFLFTLFAPVMDLALVILVGGVLATSAMSGAPIDLATLRLLAGYWLAFQSIDLLVAATGLKLSGAPLRPSTVLLVLLQRVTYRQILYVTAIRALLAAMKGTFVGWGKLIRTGRVIQPLT